MAKKSTSRKGTNHKAARTRTPPAPAQSPTTTVEDIFGQLESLGDERNTRQNARNGAGDNQFGVKHGDLRILAGKIETNRELALSLWNSGNIDAQLLATLLIEASRLSTDELDRMVRSVTFVPVADWLHSHVVKQHRDRETLRNQWMTSADRMAARAGWRLTAGRVAKSPEGLDLAALLDRLESEMGAAALEVQWTMNMCLAEIGIHFPKHRRRAIAIGERLGIYRDYPCSKGCTSPFAPIWINEMVRRQS